MKQHILTYQDPYRREIRVSSRQKILRKIVYFHKLDDLTVDRVYYSLQSIFLAEDSLVF